MERSGRHHKNGEAYETAVHSRMFWKLGENAEQAESSPAVGVRASAAWAGQAPRPLRAAAAARGQRRPACSWPVRGPSSCPVTCSREAGDSADRSTGSVCSAGSSPCRLRCTAPRPEGALKTLRRAALYPPRTALDGTRLHPALTLWGLPENASRRSASLPSLK